MDYQNGWTDRELLEEIFNILHRFEITADELKPLIRDIGPMLETNPILKLMRLGKK